MDYLLQPLNSKLCGHCCLAMILNISLEESISLIGHTKGTKTKELTIHFSHLPLRIGQPRIYSLCISRPTSKKVYGWHWVLYKEGMIYDPCIGYYIPQLDWELTLKLKISSYIPINEKAT